jgi:ABC-2 type transport system permease protein
MTAVLEQSLAISVRQLRALVRQPIYVAVTLVQPVIWLLLFGALFKRVVDLPGFGSDSYVDFLTPGIVIMSALFSAGWNGMGMLNDLQRGVLDRFLTTPVRRGPLIAGPLLQAVAIAPCCWWSPGCWPPRWPASRTALRSSPARSSRSSAPCSSSCCR